MFVKKLPKVQNYAKKGLTPEARLTTHQYP
jgi:hypothetical protein